MIFLFLIFIAVAQTRDAQTEARIESTFNSLMTEFQQDLTSTAVRSAQVDFNAQNHSNQSVQQIYLQYKSESDVLFAQFKPIARHIIENAAYNMNFKYYIYNEELKVWHFYGGQSPNPPVDGSKENTKILGKELKDAWLKLVASQM